MTFRAPCLSAGLAFVFLASTVAGAPVVIDVTGVYDENGVASNAVDKSASGAPNDVAAFTGDVAAAYAAGLGGVIGFDRSLGTPDGFRGVYGGGARYVDFNTGVSMQSVSGTGTFLPISGSASETHGTTTNSDGSSWQLDVGPVVEGKTGTASTWHQVSQVGLTALSRAHSHYPLDVRATATFSDSSTQAVTSTIGRSTKIADWNFTNTDDTFFGFTAPAGQSIESIRLESFAPGTTTPRATRVAIDDLGFVTQAKPSSFIDDFTGYSAGQSIDGQNGWTAPVIGIVEDDPGAFGNRALRVSGGSQDIFKSATVANDDTGTLFFRFFVPESESPDFAVGLTTAATPSAAGDHASSFRIVGSKLQAYDGSSFQDIAASGTLVPNSWYNVWQVLDNPSDTWQAYIEGPGFEGQHQLAAGSATDFNFRSGSGANDLVNFYIRTNNDHGGATAYVDDIYLNSTAADLTSPLLKPSSVVLIDFNNADTSPIPGALWNTIDEPGDATLSSPLPLLAANGVPSGISIGLSSTWETSGAEGNDGAFAATHPELAAAAEDYLLLRNGGTEGGVVLSGLDSDTPYRLEILSSVNDPNRDRLQDIAVDGLFADSFPDGENYDSYRDGFLDGNLLVWSKVFPDSSGELNIDVLVTGGSDDAFGGINAIRLMAIPEPSSLVLLAFAVAGLLAVRRRR